MKQEQLRAVLGYLHRIANPDGGGPGDALLLDRWRNRRDATAFEVLVWRHGTMVWNVCRRILGREQDVEDAFQATFLTFLRKADTIGQGRYLGSWLYKVAYRIALAARTGSARNAGHQEIDIDVPAPNEPEADGWHEIGPLLDEEVHRLPEKYRRPFVLCYLEGKTTDEAARDLGCPRGTVGTRLAWARERLRARLTRRGVTLSMAALTTLLVEQAAALTVPAPLVASAVKAATLATAGNALRAGVISVRAAALTQDVLHDLFITKVKTAAVLLLVVGALAGGVGLLAHQAPGAKGETEVVAQSPDLQVVTRTPQPDEDLRSEPVVRSGDRPTTREEPTPIVNRDDKPPVPPDRAGDEFPQQLSGRVVRVDRDDTSLDLEIRAKVGGESSRTTITLTDRTQLVFSNVGPNGARLTAGYSADVRLEKGSKDVAARVHVNGNLGTKNAPHRTGQVMTVSTDGTSITLEKRAKGEAAEKIAIRLTDQTRVLFSNVARNGARMTTGYDAQVWLESDSTNAAKVVTVFGSVESKPADNKDAKADRSGRIVRVSGNGRDLMVEQPAPKGGEPTRTEIRLADATQESYHCVSAGGAKPVVGYQVQVWLAEGSQNTAARARFVRGDPRPSVDARIVALSADGERFTVESPAKIKGVEPTRQELRTTARTRLVFSNVGTDGARLTEGYHIRGWLVEGSDDLADELMVSGSEKPAGKKLIDSDLDETR
jgi:RNA polymerase sigma factor (sigma-70 family)